MQELQKGISIKIEKRDIGIMKNANRIFFILTIVWMIVIFIFSGQSGEDSAGLSGEITEFVISVVYSDYDSYSTEKQMEIADTVHYIIRKGAHFTEYAILGILAVMTALTNICSKGNVKMSKAESRRDTYFKAGAGAFVFSTLYAVSDEFHQNFVDDRAPGVKDVLIDSLGALAGIVFASVVFCVFMCRYRKNRSE